MSAKLFFPHITTLCKEGSHDPSEMKDSLIRSIILLIYI